MRCLLTTNQHQITYAHVYLMISFKKYVPHLFFTYMIRSGEIKVLAGRAVNQLLKWCLVGTISLFCTLYVSQHLHFPVGIFQRCIPLSTSLRLEEKFFLPNLYWQQNLKENLYIDSHFERTGKLNTQSESKAPMTICFPFPLIFFPFSSILWCRSWKGCIWDNFKVHTNLTPQGENNHAILVLHQRPLEWYCHISLPLKMLPDVH